MGSILSPKTSSTIGGYTAPSTVSGYNPPAVYSSPKIGSELYPYNAPSGSKLSGFTTGYGPSAGETFFTSVAGALAVGSGVGLLNDIAFKPISKYLYELNGRSLSKDLEDASNKKLAEKMSKTTPPEKITLPDDILNPYAPSKFKFSEDTSPPLFAGIMQSSEVVALAIGSLVQITTDNHREHMEILANSALIQDFHSNRIASSLEAIPTLLASVIQALNPAMLVSSIGDLSATIASSLYNHSVVGSASVMNQPVADNEPIVEALDKQTNSFRQTYVPSGEFWSRADSAQIKYDAMVGTSSSFTYLPSSTHLISEVTMISNMVDNEANQAEIIKAIESYRKGSLASGVYALTMYSDDLQNTQTALNESMKKYYDHALDKKLDDVQISIADSLSRVADHADLAKEREKFMAKTGVFKDTDGDILFEGSPNELKASLDAQLHKKTDDENTIKYDDDDFLPPLPPPFIPFSPRAGIYDPDNKDDENPFEEYVNKFTSII